MGTRRSNRPAIIDLFAGAGIFSSAFQAEGFDTLRAIEKDKVAAQTYESNLGSHVEVGDILEFEPAGRCDVLVAGPPCQGFSTLNRSRSNDPRNRLSFEVVKWAKETTPSVVVIENVANFLDSNEWTVLCKRLKRLDYEVEAQILNAAEFGVAQLRYRSFTIASKIGMPTIKPLPNYKNKTVRQAWKGLRRTATGRGLHYAPTPSKLALARMQVVPPGGGRRDILHQAPELAPKSWLRLGSAVSDVWGRMEWNKPSNTLRTCLLNPSKGRYIHPTENRVITLREAARLQSIPDGWKFVGTPTQIARQIGNSVPPGVGRAVARAIKVLLGN